MTPGIYPGLTMQEYLAIPAVSQGVIQTLLDRCPKAAWYESYLNANRVAEVSDQMDAGTIAHAILLEGSAANVAVIDPYDYPAKTTGAIPQGWTNNAIRAARDEARNAGKIPVLISDMKEIKSMVTAVQEYLDTTEIAPLFKDGGGASEVTYVWKEGDTLCKCRPDRINGSATLIIDAKFTAMSAEPNAWGRRAFLDYYTGASFYRRGVKALCGVECAYNYLVAETSPPYLCSLVGVDPQAFAIGAEKIEVGLRQWAKCAANNTFPGYPSRVAYPILPPYVETTWQEQQLVQFAL